MSRTTGHVDATLYVQVEPEWGWRPAGDEDRPVKAAKAIRMTQSRPDRPIPGTVLVKLTVRVPAAAFYPLRPEAIVVVPESMAVATPVEVVAEDPAAGDAS